MSRVVPFDPAEGFPVAALLHYECLDCGGTVPSTPADSIGCSCGNVFVDVDVGRVSVKRAARVRLMQQDP